MQPFDLKELLYFDYKHLDEKKEKELGAQFAEMDDLIKKCDVITINLPLTDKTKYGFCCHESCVYPVMHTSNARPVHVALFVFFVLCCCSDEQQYCIGYANPSFLDLKEENLAC